MGAEDEELRKLEEELKALEELESKTGSYGSPSPQKKEDIFKFFKWILEFKESWKVGNLTNVEIGYSKLSIRSNLEIANYAKLENLDIVSQYFVDKANIIAGTSMGRKGFTPQLFVTSIKKEQKIREPSPQKKSWFSKKENTEGTENE